MFTYLFFDDQKLLRRSCLVRRYGTPELLAESAYSDGVSQTPIRTGFVFRMDDGRYRMLYQGCTLDGRDFCFSAVSEDGVHFEPEVVGSELLPPHALFEVPDGEIAEVVEDIHNDPAERYKMLLCRVDGGALVVHGELMVSPDLLHWTKADTVEWNGGAEPTTGVVWNEKRGCFTILVRPDWGIRRVGYVDTADWRSYTPYESCLQVDSLDEPLAEIYGMPALAYKGYYIGFPLLYRGFDDGLSAKFHGGTIDAELAYSFDAHHWQRSLRERFLSGLDAQFAEKLGSDHPMLWPAAFVREESGNILIWCAVSKKVHGEGFGPEPDGILCALRLREDGFIRLDTETSGEGILALRECIWNGGELSVNLVCKHATMAVYETLDFDVLGRAHPIEGYAHEDCIPFTGDSKNWLPVFRDGKRLSALAGRTLIFEFRMMDGSMYSVTGDCVPLMNVPGARFRTFGIIPKDV